MEDAKIKNLIAKFCSEIDSFEYVIINTEEVISGVGEQHCVKIFNAFFKKFNEEPINLGPCYSLMGLLTNVRKIKQQRK